MALVLRRSADGLRVTGALPEEHAFAPAFLERGIASGDISVSVTLHTQAGDVIYRLKDLSDDDGGRNVTAWRCELAEQPKQKGRRRG